MTNGPWRVELLRDVASFEVVAGPVLAADPVGTTVVATQVARARALEATAPIEPGTPVGPEDPWWAVVSDGRGPAAGLAMHADGYRHVCYVLGMPVGAATALGQAILDLGTDVHGVNGARPACDTVAGVLADRAGGQVEVRVHTRLFRCDTVVEPPRPAGRLRPATSEDLDLATEWWVAFLADADAMGGRTTPSEPVHDVRSAVAARIDAGCLWFWADEREQQVHLTAANPPAYGVSRVGPVYTPAEHRGKGYAAAAVAEVTAAIRCAGDLPCLFTDQANPVSNKIYERIGYRAVTDMANLWITR
jgi:GNAT superfamily N-acetyltransferase